ncbi:MAG: chromate transporter [Paludibacteraceae bacterium]|nr:chromate transporter [Paludibacteraceae bacterium]
MRLYFDLLTTFLKIGSFTLGGGYAMLALVEQAVVRQKKWIDEKEFWKMITIVQSLPGVFAVNTALYVGYRIAGKCGAAVSFLGAVLPSLLIIGAISTCFQEFRENETVMKIFNGIRPCVVALILAPSVKMFIKSELSWKFLPIPILVAAVVVFLKISPVYIIMAAIICTLCWEYRKFKDIDKKKSDNNTDNHDDSEEDDEKNVEFISTKKEND